MNIKSTGYGEDTGWKARYRLSTLNFGPHKRSLNTNTVYCSSTVVTPTHVVPLELYTVQLFTTVSFTLSGYTFGADETERSLNHHCTA
jgi:hypothetical protein